MKIRFYKRQQGVALFMSLVMLLILTLLGLSSIQSTGMQLRMSNNARDANLAFQGAESAIREAEIFLGTVNTLLTFQNDNTNGYYDAPEDGNVNIYTCSGGQVPPACFDWEVPTNNSRQFATVSTNIDGVFAQPKYIIEFIKTVVSDEDRLNLDNIGQDTGSGRTQIFRVTTYGTGGTETAHVMIQSTFGKRF